MLRSIFESAFMGVCLGGTISTIFSIGYLSGYEQRNRELLEEKNKPGQLKLNTKY